MNGEFPPVNLGSPRIKRRRRESRGPIDFTPIPTEKRREIAKRVHDQVREIANKTRQLSPEQRRAVFLKIQHDRPLERQDFAGVGLLPMGEPGQLETVVVPKQDGDLDLEKLDKRTELLSGGEENEKPKNFKLLESIKTIVVGQPHDRLSDEMKALYEEWVRKDFNVFELEVSSQKSQARSRKAEVQTVVSELNDTLGSGTSGGIYDVDYSGDGALVMLWTKGAKLKELVEDPKWQRSLSFFDVRPKFQTFSETLSDFNVEQTTLIPPQPDAETICVIDTGVAAGNPFLEQVLKTEESYSWVYGASAIEDASGHGSGVASLASYYTLDTADGGVNEARAWVVSARIMTDECELDSPQSADQEADKINECKLLSTILREVVERYRPQGIRIFVLSFEIKGNCWSQAGHRDVTRSSWVGRTIDKLSREHDVTFCCITGNINQTDVKDLIGQHGYPNYFQNPLAKLLDPGQAALAVTAGSIAHSEQVTGGRHRPIAEEGQPSPFTRSGPGFGDSIKPDFVEYGGNLVQDTDTSLVSFNAGTSVLMASGSLIPPLARSVGTSFAAPRVAFHAARILEDVKKATTTTVFNPLLRALLASSTTKAEMPPEIGDGERLSLVGFGKPNGDTALDCEGHSILLYWTGELKPNHTAIFDLHVPPEMSEYKGTKKQIQVSVATSPPVQAWGVAEYLGVHPKFWVFRGDQDPHEVEEMLQREEDEKNKAKPSVKHLPGDLGITKRSAGTLQSVTFEWTNHVEEYSENEYSLAVALTKTAKWLKAKEDDEVVQTAVVVRIEDCSGRFGELYSRVRARSGVRVRSAV